MTAERQIDRDNAVALHRSGDIIQAMSVYKSLLAETPDNADLLGLLGVANEQIGDLAEAERLLRLSLLNEAPVPLMFRNLNNLLGLLIESGRNDDARKVADTIPLPAWPADRLPDAVDHGTVVSLITALKDLGQAEKALDLARQTESFLGQSLDFAMLAAELIQSSGNTEEALLVLNRDFGANEETPNLHALRAALAFGLRDFRASRTSSTRFAATMPTLLSDATPTQNFVLAVFNAAPEYIRDFRQMRNHHYNGNFPSQLADAFADRFRFLSIFPESPSAIAAMREMPRPALALNNVVNAEMLMADDTLQKVCTVEDSLGVKVINHPRLAMQTTRQKNFERFANVPGIIFPRVNRYFANKLQRPALTTEIESTYSYPFILRTVFHQMGANTWLIGNKAELHEALDKVEDMQFYAIAYISAQHENGKFRSLRAAFVNKQPILIRADYSNDWNVRARRALIRQSFYRDNPSLLDRANQTVLNPEKELGKGALEKLQTIARMMPLDIFGMDFDITEGGELLIFEANATMNLLSTSPEGLDYSPDTENSLLGMIENFLLESTVK